MAKYSITGPDGKKYTIEGPEGATREQIISKIQERQSLAQPVAQQPQVDPYTAQAQKQTVGQNLLAGIGGGMYGLYLGGKQLLGKATPQELEEHKQAMEGLRSTGAGTTGEVVGNIAAALPTALIPGANTYLGSTAIGGALGALQPTTGEEGQRPMNVALGAAGGAGGKFIGDKLAQLLRGPKSTIKTPQQQVAGTQPSQEATAGLSQYQKKVLSDAKELGFKVSPAQASGSKTMQQFEAKLQSQPMTSGPFFDMQANNQSVLGRSVAKAIGETGDSVDASVLDSAFTRLSNIYNVVGSKQPMKVDANNFIGKLSSIEKSVEGVIQSKFADHPLVNGLFNAVAKGNPTGRDLRHYASQLGKAANQQMTTPTGNRELGIALNQVKDLADDIIENNLTGQTLKTFKEARSQYRNLSLLTDKTTNIINPSTGEVSGLNLARRLQGKDKKGFLRGKNTTDMYKAARFYQAFKPLGDSMTSTRLPTGLLESALAIPGNIASRAYLSQPVAKAAQLSQTGIAPGAGAFLDPAILRYSAPIGGGLLSTMSNQ